MRPVHPDIVPFRLTRMLTKSMGESGIEGTYRTTCERTMKVIRDNKDSIMAMLEVFVYDPLLSWRLLNNPNNTTQFESVSDDIGPIDKLGEELSNNNSSDSDEGSSNNKVKEDRANILVFSPIPAPIERSNSAGNILDAPLEEVLNSRALEVISRIQAKLIGKDFSKNEDDKSLTVNQQVDRLIFEATSIETLCQAYIGWVALW
jgi:FKBP12-rapamycin complex-associated protein